MNNRAFNKRINRLMNNNTLDSLKDIAKHYNFKVSGNKSILAARLVSGKVNMNTTPTLLQEED